MEHRLLNSGIAAGIFWICMATFFHLVMRFLVPSLGDEIPVIEVVFFWGTPGEVQLPWLIGMGLFGVAGGYCLIRVVGAADAKIVQPFEFTRMFFATDLGYFLFLELPYFWTCVGAAVICFATHYIVLHEARAKKSNEMGSVAGGGV